MQQNRTAVPEKGLDDAVRNRTHVAADEISCALRPDGLWAASNASRARQSVERLPGDQQNHAIDAYLLAGWLLAGWLREPVRGRWILDAARRQWQVLREHGSLTERVNQKEAAVTGRAR